MSQLAIDCKCGATIGFEEDASRDDVVGNIYECPECGENVLVKDTDA